MAVALSFHTIEYIQSASKVLKLSGFEEVAYFLIFEVGVDQKRT